MENALTIEVTATDIPRQQNEAKLAEAYGSMNLPEMLATDKKWLRFSEPERAGILRETCPEVSAEALAPKHLPKILLAIPLELGRSLVARVRFDQRC